MKIETYEIEPASTEIESLANDGEARLICEKLGLEGQLSLSNNESRTVFPYRVMTTLEQRVFQIHCPYQTKLQNYKSDAIPVRVLQVAAHATDCGFLHHIKVWHPREARLDPILVGHAGEYSGTLYLLARWGEVWKDWAVLLREAKAAWMLTRKAKLDKALKEVQSHQQTLQADADLFFSEADEHLSTAVYF